MWIRPLALFSGVALAAPAFEEVAVASMVDNLGLYSPRVTRYQTAHVADMDGDGVRDVLLVGGEGATVLWNQGSDAAPVLVEDLDDAMPSASGKSYEHSAAGDLDGDGDVDLIRAGWAYDIDYYENTGSSFSVVSGFFTYDPDHITIGLALGDLDADGDLDLVIADKGLHYLENVGSPTSPSFTERTSSSSNPFYGVGGTGSSYGGLALCDSDLDGDLDLHWALSSSNLYVYENAGSVSAPAFEDTYSTWPISPSSSYASPSCAVDFGARPGMLLGDDSIHWYEVQVDAPGTPTGLTALNATCAVELAWTAVAAQTAVPVSEYVVQASSGAEMTTTDTSLRFTGLAAGQSYTFQVMAANAVGRSDPSAESASVYVDGDTAPLAPTGFACVGGDYSVAASWETDATCATSYLLNGSSMGATTASATLDGLANGVAVSVVLQAVNDFGASDPVWCEATPRAPVTFVQDTVLSVVGSASFGVPTDTSYFAPALGDIDGDGDRDLLIGHTYGVAVYSNVGDDGAPVLERNETHPIEDLASSYYNSVATADTDGDGVAEIFVGKYRGNVQLLQFSASTQDYQEVDTTDALTSTMDVGDYASPAAADLDSDGDVDLLVGSSSGEIVQFTNVDGELEVDEDGVMAGVDVGSYAAPSLCDDDGDGDLDLSVGQSTGTITYFENVGDASVPVFVEQDSAFAALEGTSSRYRSSPACASNFAGGGAFIGWDGSFYWFLAMQHPEPPPVPATVTAADCGVWLNWTAVDAASEYVVSTAAGEFSEAASTTSFLFTGLQASVDYAFTVAAANAAGTSTAGSASAVVAPALAVPNQPSDLECVAGDRQVVLSWAAVAACDAAGDASQYNVTTERASWTVDSGATSLTVDDLDNYANVTLSVAATNSQGSSTAASCTVTPRPPQVLAPAALGSVIGALGALGEFMTLDPEDTGPALGDVNNDGVLDLVLGSEDDGLLLFLSGASGVLEFEAVLIAASSDGYYRPALGDVDGDGDVDLLVGNSDGEVQFFRNVGDASNPSFSELGASESPLGGFDAGFRSAPAFGDVNGDGYGDVVMGDSYGSLVFFEGLSDGTFEERVGDDNPFDGVDVGDYAMPALCDLDLDGDVDCVVGSSSASSGLRWLENGGGAGFAALQELTAGGEDIDFDSYLSPACVGGVGVLVGAEGDDRGPLAWFSSSVHPEAPTAAPSVTPEECAVQVEWVAVDGASGYVVSAESTSLAQTSSANATSLLFTGLTADVAVTFSVVAFNDAGSSVSSPDSVAVAAASGEPNAPMITSCVAGDNSVTVEWDAVALCTSSGSVASYDVTLNGSATPITTNATAITLDGLPNLAAVTVTVVASGSSATAACTATPRATPTAVEAPLIPNTGSMGLPSLPSLYLVSLLLTDLSGSGVRDLLLCSSSSACYILPNSGTDEEPVFEESASSVVYATDGYARPAAVDVNDDGIQDLVLGDYDGGLNVIFSFEEGSSIDYSVIENPFGGFDIGRRSHPSATDWDGDGDLDLLVGSEYGFVQLLRNDGGGLWTEDSAGSWDSGLSNTAPSFCDVDGDGDEDLLLGSAYKVSLWENVAAASSSGPMELVQVSDDIAPDTVSSYYFSPACAADFGGHTGFFIGTYGNSYSSLAFVELSTHPESPPAPVISSEDWACAVSLEWTAVAGATSYTVTAEPSGTQLVASEPSLAFSGLAAGVNQSFTVVATNAGGSSGSSGASVAAAPRGTAVLAPSNLTCTAGDYAVAANWSDVCGASGYVITVTGAIEDSWTQDTTSLSLAAPQNGVEVFVSVAPVEDATAVSLCAATPFDDGQLLVAEDLPPVALTFTKSLMRPALVDIDGDGDDDLFVSRSSSVYFLKNVGTDAQPDFVDASDANPLQDVSISSVNVAFGDLDADGDFDAVLGGLYDYHLDLYKNYGSPTEPEFSELSTFASPLFGAALARYAYAVPALGDMDGDGDLDLFIGTQYQLIVYENVGSAYKAEFSEMVDLRLSEKRYYAPCWCDVYGSGAPRIVYGDSSGGIWDFATAEQLLDVDDTYAMPTCTTSGTGLLVGSYYDYLSLYELHGHPSVPSDLFLTNTTDSCANLEWTAPADDGGASITSYTVVWDGTEYTRDGDSTTFCVPVADGATGFVEFSVTAANEYGSSGAAYGDLAFATIAALAVDARVEVTWEGSTSLFADATRVQVFDSSGTFNYSQSCNTTSCWTTEVIFAAPVPCGDYSLSFRVWEDSALLYETATAETVNPCDPSATPAVCAALPPGSAPGEYWIAADGVLPILVHCAGSWTVVAAGSNVTGVGAVSDGDPVAFESYRLDVDGRRAVAALSTSTLIVRSDSGASLSLDAPMFVGAVSQECTATAGGETADVELSDGTVALASGTNCSHGMLLASGYSASASLGPFWNATSSQCSSPDFDIYVALNTSSGMIDTSALTSPSAKTNEVFVLADNFSFALVPPGAAVEVSVDGADWTSLDAATYAPTEGEHELLARAVLPWGAVDETPVAIAWTLDTTAPSVTLSTTGASSSSTSVLLSVEVTESDAVVYTCVDGTTCEELAPWSDGAEEPETVLVSVDGVNVTVSSPTAADVVFEYSLDAGSWTEFDGGGNVQEFAGLAAGWHAVQVRAVSDSRSDSTPVGLGLLSGNATNSAATAVAPDTTILSSSLGSAASTTSRDITVAVNSTVPGSAMEYSLDMGVTWADLGEDGVYERSGMSNGCYHLSVRAVGDPTPVAVAWQVVSWEPETTLLSDPPASVLSTADAAWEYELGCDSDPQYECTLFMSRDLGFSWTELNGTAGAVGGEDVLAGQHALLFKAVDSLDQADATPLLVEWQVVAQPQLEVVAQPSSRMLSSTAVFVFAVTDSGDVDCAVSYTVTSLADLNLLLRGSVAPEEPLVLTELPYGQANLRASVRCEVDGGGDVDVNWELLEDTGLSMTVDDLEEGAHVATAYAIDAAGNVGADASKYSWLVDLTAPQTEVDTPFAITSGSSVSVGASCDDASSCQFNYTGNAVLQDSPFTVTLDRDDRFELYVFAVDAAGNADDEGVLLTVVRDSRPPGIELVALSSTVSQSPSFSVACNDTNGCFALQYQLATASGTMVKNVPMSVDVGTVSPALLQPLDDDSYVVTVTAQDEAGNVNATSLAFTLDTTAPETAWVQAPPSIGTSPNVSAALECQDLSQCSFDVTLDSVAWGSLVSDGLLSLLGLAEGAHEVSVVAVDEAGNADSESPVTAAFELDWTGPEIAVGEAVYSTAGDSVSLAFTCTDASSCFVEALASNVSVNISAAGVLTATAPDGGYTVSLTSRDAVDNVGDGFELDVLFDTVAPVVALSSPVPQLTKERELDVRLNVSELNLQECACSMSEGAVACSFDEVLGEIEASATVDVDEASPVLDVSCVDARGHSGSASVSWAVDAVAPVLGLERLSAPLRDAWWPLAFTAVDSSAMAFQCTVGKVLLADEHCAPPLVNVSAELVDFAESNHSVTVLATDAAGNVAAALSSVVYDATPPEIEVVSRPESATTKSDVVFEFRCVAAVCECAPGELEEDPDCAFEYQLDSDDPDGEWLAAASPLELNVTAYGVHFVNLRATDEAGNVAVLDGSLEWSRELDNEVPSIDAYPPAICSALQRTFSFAFSMSVTPQVEYRLDSDSDWTTDGLYASPDSPETTVLLELELNHEELTYGVPKTRSLDVRQAGVAGTDTSATWIVARCDDDTQLEINGTDGARKCAACPDNESCVSEYSALKDGYWLPKSQNEVYKCLTEEACHLGGCTAGHTGVLCAVCDTSDEDHLYAKSLNGVCEECNETSTLWVTIVIGSLGVLTLGYLAAFVVKESLEAAVTVRAVSTLKIMANYFLMMSILKNFSLDWGSMVDQLFSYMGVASGGNIADVQLVNCAFPLPIYVEYAGYFAAPLLLLTAPALFIYAIVWSRRFRKWRAGERQPRYMLIWGVQHRFLYRQCVLVLSYFSYPVLVSSAFRVMNCDRIEDSRYLVDDYREECSGPTYVAFFTIGLIFVCVLAPAVPLAIFRMMHRFRGSGNTSATESQKHRKQFFFFYGEYKPEWYFWEMTVMGRKVAMSAISVLLSSDTQGWQVYAGTWMLLASFVAQITCLPHKDPRQRTLEILSQGTVLTSLLLGHALAFEATKEDAALAEAFSATILSLNLAVMGLMVGILLKELGEEAARRVGLRKSVVRRKVDSFKRELRTRSRGWSSAEGVPGFDLGPDLAGLEEVAEEAEEETQEEEDAGLELAGTSSAATPAAEIEMVEVPNPLLLNALAFSSRNVRAPNKDVERRRSVGNKDPGSSRARSASRQRSMVATNTMDL